MLLLLIVDLVGVGMGLRNKEDFNFISVLLRFIFGYCKIWKLCY